MDKQIEVLWWKQGEERTSIPKWKVPPLMLSTVMAADEKELTDLTEQCNYYSKVVGLDYTYALKVDRHTTISEPEMELVDDKTVQVTINPHFALSARKFITHGAFTKPVNRMDEVVQDLVPTYNPHRNVRVPQQEYVHCAKSTTLIRELLRLKNVEGYKVNAIGPSMVYDTGVRMWVPCVRDIPVDDYVRLESSTDLISKIEYNGKKTVRLRTSIYVTPEE